MFLYRADSFSKNFILTENFNTLFDFLLKPLDVHIFFNNITETELCFKNKNIKHLTLPIYIQLNNLNNLNLSIFFD